MMLSDCPSLYPLPPSSTVIELISHTSGVPPRLATLTVRSAGPESVSSGSSRTVRITSVAGVCSTSPLPSPTVAKSPSLYPVPPSVTVMPEMYHVCGLEPVTVSDTVNVAPVPVSSGGSIVSSGSSREVWINANAADCSVSPAPSVNTIASPSVYPLPPSTTVSPEIVQYGSPHSSSSSESVTVMSAPLPPGPSAVIVGSTRASVA